MIKVEGSTIKVEAIAHSLAARMDAESVPYHSVLAGFSIEHTCDVISVVYPRGDTYREIRWQYLGATSMDIVKDFVKQIRNDREDS